MPNLENLNIHEAHEHAEMAHGDPTLGRVSLTMAVLAVCAAAISTMGHRAHNEVLLLQTQVNFHKAEMIGQSTQRHANDVLLKSIGVLASQNNSQASAAREEIRKESESYLHEEEQSRIEEERLERDKERIHRKANRLDLGELLCEMALVLCSITLLTRQKVYWLVGVVAGVASVITCVTAFLA